MAPRRDQRLALHLGRPDLRLLLLHETLFSSFLMATAPITSVLMLRDLGFTAWQYGLTIGLPCLSGLMGSVLTPRLVTRLGQHRTLLVFGVAKTLFVAHHLGPTRLLWSGGRDRRHLDAAAGRARLHPKAGVLPVGALLGAVRGWDLCLVGIVLVSLPILPAVTVVGAGLVLGLVVRRAARGQ